MVIGVSEGPGAVRMQNEKEAGKCPFAFLRRKILPRYYKLTRVEGNNALLWAVEKIQASLRWRQSIAS